ncbi:hypothetical protein C8Q79DRAFT_980367 [Trametes meyenii]|nr:hypothetical protein C8Q79DRAFT_980367 [Trametes meyenii]
MSISGSTAAATLDDSWRRRIPESVRRAIHHALEGCLSGRHPTREDLSPSDEAVIDSAGRSPASVYESLESHTDAHQEWVRPSYDDLPTEEEIEQLLEDMDRDGLYPCGSRPSLWDRHAWALVPADSEPNLSLQGHSVVRPWSDDVHLKCGVLRFNNTLLYDVWRSVTHLKLQLDATDPDREDTRHGHELFSLSNKRANFPNAGTLCELVQLCRLLGDRLEGLSVTMCLPELVVPHVPRFVHDVARICSKLQAFEVEDTQCEHFARMPHDDFRYLLSAAETDRPAGERLITEHDHLRALVLRKRSVLPWYDEYAASEMALDPEQHTGSREVECGGGVANPPKESPPANEQTPVFDEASLLALIMRQEFPSLRVAQVVIGGPEFRTSHALAMPKD